MPGERVHVELGFFDDSGRAIIGARATPYEADGTTPLAGMKSAATGGSNITSVSTGVTGKAEFWITGLPRRYKVVWDDNSLTARVAGHVNPLAAFSVTRGPHDMVPPPLEAAQLDENQTWTGAQNFTGGLTVDGEELATDAALSAVSDAVTAEVTRATDREDEIDAALAQEVSDRDDADDARITTALRFAQLDRQGVNALGVTNGRVRKAFELADEVDVDWSTLIPYVNANATVSGNRLRATAVTSPSGVKIPFPLTASEDCAFSVIIEIGAANADGGVNKATMVGFYQADSASSIVASSTDAFTAGILSGSGSAFTIGRKAFSGAQTTLGDTDLVTGELIRVTGVTDSESVSLQVLRNEARSWSRRFIRDDRRRRVRDAPQNSFSTPIRTSI